MSCESFPIGIAQKKDLENPAIQLFGNRLFNDQSSTELLIEFLLVTTSSKRVTAEGDVFDTPLPVISMLADWPEVATLQYAPKAKLNLKLFAFMGASRLDSRHETHRQQYKELLEQLQAHIRVVEKGAESDVLRTLENLFLGFQGAGSGRTWCAQSFVPICPGFLAGETIWNEKEARRQPPSDWLCLMEDLQSYFTMNKHRFLARGGEVLYLQLCNALRQTPEAVQRWVRESKVQLEPEEQKPAWLHSELQRELRGVLAHCPRTVTDIADFIDTGVECDTADATDNRNGETHFVNAGWCPVDAWQEGYLFGVDLLHICLADLDILERLQLLETACALQVLRSLAAQSVRHCPPEREVSWPGYRLGVSAPDEKRLAVKRISQHTVRAMEKLVYKAVRCDDVDLPNDKEKREKTLKEADTRYGSKLFISTAKRVGLLVPRRGAGARFTLNEQLLRLLVATIVPTGGHLTYDSFKQLVGVRYGLVFDAAGLAQASAWADGVDNVHLDSHCDAWVKEMLEAAGLLIHLSDSCALVRNPASKGSTQLGRSMQ